jgi:hypothetical protein
MRRQEDATTEARVKLVGGSRATISSPRVGSRPVVMEAVGSGSLRNVSVDEVRDAEQISYAYFWAHSGCDLLVKRGTITRGSRYTFRLIYPRCEWVRADELPPMYREIAEAWLKLRRRGTL